jgi:hypothetical protein
MIPLNKTEKQTVNCNLARIVQREMEHWRCTRERRRGKEQVSALNYQ